MDSMCLALMEVCGSMKVASSTPPRLPRLKKQTNFEFTWHKAAGKTITLGKEPDDRYVSFGPVTLIDGLKGRADSP